MELPLELPQTPPLPAGTRPLRHQVGGHAFGKGKTKLGMLERGDGVVLKPLQNGFRGERELAFYQQVFDPGAADPVIHQLRPLLSKYQGTWTTPEHPGVLYFGLDDITKDFKYPCVLDIKVGAITYDPSAGPDKIARETAKCPYKAITGFSLTGAKVYNPDTKLYTIRDAEFFRNITEDEVLTQGLEFYFNKTTSCFKPGIVHALMKKLESILKWSESQRKFSFHSSSILFVYDALALTLCSICQNLVSNECNICHCNGIARQCNKLTKEMDFGPFVDARMIDFTHAFSSQKQDLNYLNGVKGIMKYFNKVVDSSWESSNVA